MTLGYKEASPGAGLPHNAPEFSEHWDATACGWGQVFLWWRTRTFHNWDSSINWMAVGGSQEALRPPLGLSPGLASALYFTVSSWCRQQISEDGSTGAALTETFPSWLETLGTRSWGMPTSCSWIESATYCLIASRMNLTWKYSRPSSHSSLHMGRRKQEKKLQVSQRLGINVIQESPAELVISLFVTVNYERAGLYCVHFLSSILMQVSSMPFSLPQNEKFYKLPTKN